MNQVNIQEVIDIDEIPQLDIEMAPNDVGANESGVHHPILIFAAIAVTVAIG